MEVVKAKAWKEFFSKNRTVPLSFDRISRETGEPFPVCIALRNIEGINVKEGEGVQSTEYRVRVSLFDITYKQFFGRPWNGPVVSARSTGGKAKINYNQNIYLYTSSAAQSIVLSIELIAIQNLGNGKSRNVSRGWSIFRLFDNKSNLEQMDLSKDGKPFSVDMYYGTPRSLLTIDEPIEDNPNMIKSSGCVVNLSLSYHGSLLKIQHLLPENVIIGPNDIVPGVVDSLNTETNIKDCFRKPRLLKPMKAYLDNVTVTLYPNIDKFEDELLSLLNEDRVNREGIVADGQSVNIVERRLSIGVHNGFCYVEKPEVAHLVPQELSQRRGTSLRRTSNRTSSYSSLPNSPRTSMGTSFVLRDRVPLSGMVYDPMFTVVFNLEYLISEPVTGPRGKNISTRQFPVMLRWTAWTPFTRSPNSSNETMKHTVPFIGGDLTGPDELFCYKLPHSHMDNDNTKKEMCGALNFTFIDSAKAAAPVETMEKLAIPGSQYASSPGGPVYASDTSRSDLLSITNQPHTNARPPHSPAIQRQERQPLPPPREEKATPRRSDTRMLEGTDQHPYNQPPYGPQGQAPYQTSPNQQQPILISQNPQQMMMSYPVQPVVGYPPQAFPPVTGPMSYPMEIRHISEGGLAGGVSMGPPGDLHELPFTPVHAPIMAVPPGGRSTGHGLSRAAYARLYSADFPPILDRHKQDAEVVNPDDYINFVMAREESDPLQCNEIVMQFLAFSRLATVQADGGIESHHTVFFTFQFYKFPHITTERLLLGQPEQELTTNKSAQPRILRRLNANGTMKQGAAGYQIKYLVDPTHMKPGEGALFVKHLSQQTLHVDVWDGDSLLLIGSCAVELKHLCRQGREGVQVTYELDIVSTEVNEEFTGLTGDLARGGSIRPVGVHTLLKGKLHFRLANLGHPVDSKFLPKNRGSTIQPLTSSGIIKPDKASVQGSFTGGSLNNIQNTQEFHKRTVRANHLTALNSELASILYSKKDPTVEENNKTNSRIARMQAVRDSQKHEHITDENSILRNVSSFKQKKAERARDLKIMESYRMQNKEDGIRRLLNQAITTEYTIHPCMGSAEFFEFQLSNPNNTETTVSIRTDSDNISVISDAREWRHFKQVYKLNTPLEEGMFNLEVTKRDPEVFLRPKETVYIPMKYLSFEANHGVSPDSPGNDEVNIGLRSSNAASLNKSLMTRVLRVYFSSVTDNKLISILALKVEPEPHIIDQTFRFHQPEQSFLKKSIRLPPFHNAVNREMSHSGFQQLFVKCSDENVVCESYKRHSNEPQDVFIKSGVGMSPNQKKFFVCIYTDRYLSKPDQIWQFYIHALQRVDVSCVEGQTTRLTLILRGTQSTRLVKCYSSHKNQMQISPSTDFMLAPSAVHELHVGVRPLQRGTKFFYINVVDVECHQLVRNWLVCVNCSPPVISKTFELQLPAGGGKGSNKRISFTNPYSHNKTFILTNNRNDLLHFKETRLEMTSKETRIIGLKFMPAINIGSAEILIFINDDEDKNEETFCIRVTYISDDE